MNDDFLRRIRVEPPPDFLARLKSRLDLQPPPGPAKGYPTLEKLASDVLERPTVPSPRRSLLRTLALAVLFAGAVFAITLLTLNREKPEPPISTNTQSQPRNVPTQTRPETPTHAPEKFPAVAAKQAAATDKSTPPSAMTANLVAPRALAPYLTSVLKRYGMSSGIRTTDSTVSALTAFCSVHDPAKPGVNPLLAVTTRRITRSEFETCTHKVGPIAEVSLGHQVIVLARSKAYGTFSLTPTQIFLALAAEIPDPAQPGKLITNPNRAWSDVDSTLEREPIEILGPEASSPVGMAFQEIVFEPGCRAIPELATVKQCPKLRQDGVYEEVPDSAGDIQFKLQSRPNALGIVGFGLFELFSNLISASPINAVAPGRDTVANNTYPAARPLYLYVNQDAGNLFARYLPSWLTHVGPVVPDRFAVVPPEPPPPWDPSAVPPRLPDLNLQ